MLPLSAFRVNVDARPLIFSICPFGNRAWVPNTLPVRLWQSRQWQTEIRTGSPSQSILNCPQAQAACRVVM
jgi:hypothetical protein